MISTSAHANAVPLFYLLFCKMAGTKRVRAVTGYGGRGTAKRQRAMPRVLRKPNLLKAVQALSETKVVDIELGYTTDGLVPYSISLVNGVAVGSDLYQRVGRSIFMKHIECNYQILKDNTAVSANAFYLRLMIIQDMAPNGAALPVLADFVRQINATGAAATTVQGMQNTNNLKRFKFLHDAIIPVPAWNTTTFQAADATLVKSDCNRKFRLNINKKMQFSGTGSAASDVQTNAVYFVVAHGHGTTTPTHNILGRFRMTFYDM